MKRRICFCLAALMLATSISYAAYAVTGFSAFVGHGLGQKYHASLLPVEEIVYTVDNAPYIGNANTKKFHYASCSSVDKMNEKNKVPLGSRSVAIDQDFVPCKRCEP